MQKIELPKGLNIRPSTSKDVSFIEELYVSLRDDLDLMNAEKDFIVEIKRQQFQAQSTSYEEQFPNAMTFIIEHHEDRVGRAILDFGTEEIRIVDISLIKQMHGKGFGSGVVQSFIASAEQIRAPLRLSVLSSNTVAKQLYIKLGFVIEGNNGLYDLMAYYPQSPMAV